LMGIDNATITVEGPEVPIMDGSALAFCEAIAAAGIYEQSAPRKVAIVKKKIEVRKGDKLASIAPSHRLHIQARIEWNHPSIGVQEYSYTVGKSDFREIAGARTFGFLKDVEALQKMGLARGGSLDNAIVLDENRVTNPGGLRFADEFVRHKVLDAIGDFALSPITLLGDVNLVKAGHELHSELVSAVFAHPDNYEVKLLSDLAPRPTAATPSLASSSHAVSLQRVY
jgi:UDP-3-O-[3-hydroxymyristoyl] N-acetylglucosamine deacetylase